MKAVVIEASTERSIAALFKEGQLAGEARLPVGLTSSKHLLRELQKLMKPADIDLIIAGVGPGSYTGIRVGATIAKTLSFACGIPLVGVCSLEGFQPEGDGAFAAVIDAKISGMYIRYGEKRGGIVYWEGEASVRPLEEISVGVTPFKGVLESKLRCGEWIERYPDARAIYESGVSKYLAGKYTQDGTMELNYLRNGYLLPPPPPPPPVFLMGPAPLGCSALAPPPC